MTPDRLQPTQRPAAMVWGASLWIASAGNLPLWRELQAQGLLAQPGGAGLALALFGAIAGLLVALLSLLAWRGVLRPAIALLLLATALGSYFMLSYGVVIDRNMILSVFQTDRAEAGALLNLRLLVAVAVLALLPAAWLLRRPARLSPWPLQAVRNAGMAALAIGLAAGLVLVAFQPLSSAMRNHKSLRYLLNPLNSLYALGDAVSRPLRRQPGQLAPLGRDARLAAPGAGSKPPLLVLVLGETGRSGNFGLNGYARDTTPELAQLGVASWANVWSCGTSTAASVPCMFSHLGREAFDARRQDHENLLDVLQHAGLAVLWVDNQGGCKGVCDRVPSVNTSQLADPRHCEGAGCRDGILLEGLDERLAALPAERRARGVVLVLHTIGSHGPAYAERSPPAFKRFQPECRSNQLADCDREALVNAYDNSIAYTDHVLAATVRWLQARSDRFDTALLYLADHGESLGENNLYLHGLPYAIAPDVQKRVPWITWLAPGFEQRSGIALACLRGAADARLSHDHFFHSVLGLLQVQTAAYRRDLDAYAACAAH